MKRILAIVFVLVILAGSVNTAFAATTVEISDHVKVTGFDKNVDYTAEIQKLMKTGGPYAMELGAILERMKNLKIDTLGMSYKKTNYFSRCKTPAEVLAAMEADNKPKYTKDELDLLSRIIYAEAGSSWIPDWVQRMVGSVVLNRVESSRYPNTIRAVIYQPGQYSPTWNGAINKTPDARTIANAKYLLENGSICPANVLGQSSAIQGKIYKSYYDPILKSTEYFCYM